MSDVWQKGDLLRLSAEFSDLNDNLIDPDVVAFYARKPSGTAFTRTYPSSIVRTSAGNYHIDLDLDEVGEWGYTWSSTGSGQAAENGLFLVEANEI